MAFFSIKRLICGQFYKTPWSERFNEFFHEGHGVPPFVKMGLFGVRVRIKNKVLLNGVFFKKVGNKVDGIILIGKKVLKRPMVQVPFIKLGKFCRCLFDGDYLFFRVFFDVLKVSNKRPKTGTVLSGWG